MWQQPWSRIQDWKLNRTPRPPILPALLELMSYAEEHYRQGAELIAEGEFAKARSEFDVAINALLEGEWDVLSTPRLEGFFEDLLVRIQQDEARYLQPEESVEDVEKCTAG